MRGDNMRVAAIGDNCVDVYPRLDRYYCTGNCVDFAVHMKRLGAEVSLISTTGNDEYGRQMILELLEEKIDVSHLKTGDGETAISYMDLVDRERTYGDYIEGVMENVEFTEEDIEFAASHDLIHTAFWGNAHKHLPELKKKGAKICFDYATEVEDPLVDATIAYVDYAFFSFETCNLEVKDFLKKIVEKGSQIAVATFGEGGSLAYDGEKYYQYGIHPAEVVNTVGAGDSYMAGFMYAVMSKKEIPECQKTGAEIAAKVVGVFEPWEKGSGQDGN